MNPVIKPGSFSSQDEYDQYLSCLFKANVGDSISLYIKNDPYGGGRNLPSYQKTNNIYDGITIVAKRCVALVPNKHNTILLLGMRDKSISFWEADTLNDRFNDLKITIKNISDYTHFWSANITDTRISQIVHSRPAAT